MAPNASPYVFWSSIGGGCGTIVISDADKLGRLHEPACGDVDKWEMHGTLQPPAYSRALHIFKDYQDHLMIVGGGIFGEVEIRT